MNCKELIEYLRRFDETEPVAVVAVDLQKRQAAKWKAYQLLDELPVIVLEIDCMEALDDIEEGENNANV